MPANYEGAAGALDIISGGNGEIFYKVYNDLGAAVTNGDVYFLDWQKDADSLSPSARPTLVLPATSSVYRQVVVVNNALLNSDTIADASWGYVQYRGYCPKVAAASTTAIDDYLQGTNGTAVSSDDGTSQTTDSFGIAITDEDTVAGFVEAMLFGQPVTIG